MMKTAATLLMLLSVAGTVSSMNTSSDVTLVTFDGTPGTTFTFTKNGIPSNKQPATTGTWNISDGIGRLDGDLRVEFKAGKFWPGYIRATAEGDFHDASTTIDEGRGALVLTVRSKTPEYTGFFVSFATTKYWRTTKMACSDELGPYANRGCYKANFMVPAGDDFVDVRIPFTSFSDMWLHWSSGEPYKTCTADQTVGDGQDTSVCVTAEALASILQFDFWFEGIKGNPHLEVKSIAASK